MTGAWGALPPEVNSAGFWLGPGAESFMLSAAQLAAVAASVIANLGGHAAVSAALAASWPDPTGEFAVLANVPHLLWQAMAASLLAEAAAQIEATGMSFETLKAATPTPFEIDENQIEHGILQATNFMGCNSGAIAANRANYTRMWVTAADNKYSYAAASAAGVHAIPPLPPPPPTSMGGASGAAPATSLASGPMESMASSGGGMESMMSMFTQPLSQMSSMASGGGPLQGIMQLPQQAMSPLQSLMSSMGQMGSMGNPGDAMAGMAGAGWLTGAPSAGGPVAANLISGGGGGGLGGIGGALRGPAGWGTSPTVAGSPSGEAAALSRFGEARAASGVPANTAGMGGTGGMMGPMAHGAGDQDKQESGKRKQQHPLTSLASLYRSPAGVPVITGSGGAVFGSREGVGGT